MAVSQAAFKVEQALGHDDNAITEQDVANPALNPEKYGDQSDTMMALTWQGKNSVKISE